MATLETWQKVDKYFKIDSTIDRWGDVEAISDEHLLRLFDFRSWLGVPIYVTAGVKISGHAKSSYHYSRFDEQGNQVGACATDVVIPDYHLSPFDLLMDATRFGFTGIGYYPHWTYKGIPVGGLHLDSRPLRWDKDQTLNYSHSRWMGILNPDGKQEYIELNFHNLVKYANYAVDETPPMDIH